MNRIMNIAFDIRGVLSKYPDEFSTLVKTFMQHPLTYNIFVITDMHDKNEIVEMLRTNGFGRILAENIHCADYKKYGEMCKAILCRDLGIDILIDDFSGYLQWDSTFGPAPLRLQVCPDATRPYWHPNWKVSVENDFGRRVYSK